jgi:Putative beta barrel porin-7 (BBP7)
VPPLVAKDAVLPPPAWWVSAWGWSRFGVRAFVGYDLIYFSNVVRPGNQIDTTLNLTGSPAISPSIPFSGAARPAPIFITSSFWVQGINFGESYTF